MSFKAVEGKGKVKVKDRTGHRRSERAGGVGGVLGRKLGVNSNARTSQGRSSSKSAKEYERKRKKGCNERRSVKWGNRGGKKGSARRRR